MDLSDSWVFLFSRMKKKKQQLDLKRFVFLSRMIFKLFLGNKWSFLEKVTACLAQGLTKYPLKQIYHHLLYAHYIKDGLGPLLVLHNSNLIHGSHGT